ncbi:hypothetical protein RUND412_004781 [Rhizina undulata]
MFAAVKDLLFGTISSMVAKAFEHPSTLPAKPWIVFSKACNRGLGNLPAILAYQSNNIQTNSKRLVCLALQIGFGGIGGIFASTVYRKVNALHYLNGLWATIGCQFFILLAIEEMSFYFGAMNRAKREGRIKELEGNQAFKYTI